MYVLAWKGTLILRMSLAYHDLGVQALSVISSDFLWVPGVLGLSW